MTERGRPGNVSRLRLVLGVVYTAMAVGQLASIDRMPTILGTYGLLHGRPATALALGLIVGEAVCGLWFLLRPRSRAAAPVWIYTAVSAAWSALAVQASVRGLTVPNCGCFGRYLRQHLSGITLAQDVLTLFYAAVLLRGLHRTSSTANAPEREEAISR
jgi:hypothetical protein